MGKQGDSVSSKVEITSRGKDARAVSLHAYHVQIKGMSKKITAFACKLSPENLLSVKMALMGAVREVEGKMRERKEG